MVSIRQIYCTGFSALQAVETAAPFYIRTAIAILRSDFGGFD